MIYNIIETEVPIDSNEYCSEYTDFGRTLARIYRNQSLIYQYGKIEKNVSLYSEETVLERDVALCHEIMKNDIGIIIVRLENSKYMKTIMNKRTAFTDRLANLGKWRSSHGSPKWQ